MLVDALALALGVEVVRVGLEARVFLRVDDLVGALLEGDVLGGDGLVDPDGVAEQDRPRDALVDHDPAGLEHAGVLALGEDQDLGLLAGAADEAAQDRRRASEQRAHGLAVGLLVELTLGDARLDGRLGHGRRDGLDHARVEGLGDDVVAAEAVFVAVGSVDDLRHALARELGEGVGRRELHRLVDLRGPDVEGPAEDAGEAEHVVDLVVVVAASGRDDRVGSGLAGLLVGDFGLGVGERKDDGVGGHGLDHVGGHEPADGQAEEHVGADEGLGEGALVGLARELLLDRVEVVALGVDDPAAVTHEQVLALDPERDVEARAGHGRGPGPADDDLDVLELALGQGRGVEQRGARDDRRAVLVVVEDRDLHAPLELLLDVEAGRGADVLEVDAAEGRLERRDALDEGVGILGVDLEVEHVDVGEFFEQDALALHDRLGGEGSDVAEAEHRRAVRDDGDEVAARSVEVGGEGILGDLEARLGDAGRVGQGQVALTRQGLGRDDRDLAGAALGVEVEGFFARELGHLKLESMSGAAVVSTSLGCRWSHGRRHTCRRLRGDRRCAGSGDSVRHVAASEVSSTTAPPAL